MQTALIIALWVLTVIACLFVGGFLNSYMSKKGENLATHEDIAKLNEQMRVLTTTQEEIKAKISSDVWDRQKQWEMKREVLFEASKILAQVEDELVSLQSAAKLELSGNPEWPAYWNERLHKWQEASSVFAKVVSLVIAVCSRETAAIFIQLHGLAGKIAGGLASRDKAAYEKQGEEFMKKASEARIAIRKELGVDESRS